MDAKGFVVRWEGLARRAGDAKEYLGSLDMKQRPHYKMSVCDEPAWSHEMAYEWIME